MTIPSCPPADAHDFDVLIVGGGAAGLYAALSVAPQWRVGLITKDTLQVSASDWAQGGIAAALAPEDSPQLHVQDTLVAGGGLCETSAVDFLTQQAADCIQRLVQLGVAFDRNRQGQLATTLEAAHSRRRVLHAADTTGRAVVSVLAQVALQRPNIQVLESAFVVDLWLDGQGICRGVNAVYQQQLQTWSAQATVLATGGGGQVYAHTTNPAASTGDGVAMVWRAGGQLRDLEFVQFHPTSLSIAGAPPFLISEAVRGEGAHVVDDTGHRFLSAHHAAGELAPRDVVSRGIFQHLRLTGEEQVWLDMRPIPPARIQQRFPNIMQVCRTWGVDPLQQPVPVAPAAHYWMGGIVTDQLNQTSISGLYALGENASTGVHGANRLASNSLLECLVYGAQLEHLPLQPGTGETPSATKAVSWAEEPDMPRVGPSFQDRRQALAHLMWTAAGISRNGAELEQALAQVTQWRQDFAQHPLTTALTVSWATPAPRQLGRLNSAVLRDWGELRNLLDVAALILQSAHFRQESRGGHFRQDYPQAQTDWQAHTLVQGEQWQRTPLGAS